ncbi:methyltransferase domain-containing protein [candidate division KSB1 bacterium]|nr:methyltransferase domain-containing protein [candidate division KSB1 bacterium]
MKCILMTGLVFFTGGSEVVRALLKIRIFSGSWEVLQLMSTMMIDIWGLKACFYDQIREYWPLNRILKLELANIQKVLGQAVSIEGPVLDLGCGTGTLSRILSSRLDITGIDKSRQMLNRCRKKSYHYLVQANAQCLPLRKNCYNLVVAVGLLEYFRNPDFLLSAVHDVIRPGGYFLFTISPSTWFTCLRKAGGIPLYYHSTDAIIEKAEMACIASEKSSSQIVLLFQKRR